MLSFQQNWRTSGWNRFCPKAFVEEVAEAMNTHVNKCKNDKIKENFKNKLIMESLYMKRIMVHLCYSFNF
jgi:hypothetical protein